MLSVGITLLPLVHHSCFSIKNKIVPVIQQLIRYAGHQLTYCVRYVVMKVVGITVNHNMNIKYLIIISFLMPSNSSLGNI